MPKLPPPPSKKEYVRLTLSRSRVWHRLNPEGTYLLCGPRIGDGSVDKIVYRFAMPSPGCTNCQKAARQGWPKAATAAELTV